MTVVAFDGRYVAVDRQSTTDGGICSTTRKYVVDGRRVYVGVGAQDHSVAMMDWLKRGGDEQKFWRPLSNDHGSTLYVFEWGQPILVYEAYPYPATILDTQFAGGCGGAMAMGAMAAGVDAKRAVEIVAEREAHCGMGVDVIDLWELAREYGRGTVAGEAAAPSRAAAA